MSTLKASIGRQRRGKKVSPFENSYVSEINKQFTDIRNALERAIDSIEQVTPDILYNALKPTFELSQTYVPVDSGRLKASGFLQKDTSTKKPRVTIGYGRAGIPNYAAHVHERIDIPHQEPTRSKFLSAALDEDSSNIQKRILDQFKRFAR